MFLKTKLDQHFSHCSFSLIELVRRIEFSSSDISQDEGFSEFTKWHIVHEDCLNELGFSNKKSSWCWARMIERNLTHKQERKSRKVSLEGHDCVYCKIRPTEHLDHIWPISLGGPPGDKDGVGIHKWNFAPTCAFCNSIKGNAPLSCTANETFLQGFIGYCLKIYGHEFRGD